ncbi:MAG: outer membrane lipoprotein carrier protein LolA [Bacteroidales bacterium]|jgi:outer membrane lipoprotein-sorting protein|nr:outer membrane lipoprotein carrier protein LolA [Bacteroidales bacterium]
MRKTKFLDILFVLLLLSSFNFAQNVNESIQLLDEVVAKIDKYSTLKIEFNLNLDNQQTGKVENYKCSAVYKTGFYKMDMMGQIVFSDGKTNWTYLKDAEEVNITINDSKNDLLTNPKIMLQNYKKDFKVTQISDKFEKSRTLVTYDLYPKQIDGKKFSKLTLKIDKTTKQIFSVTYVGKDGISYSFEIIKLLENPVIPDSEIKYSDSLFPNADVIDMR